MKKTEIDKKVSEIIDAVHAPYTKKNINPLSLEELEKRTLRFIEHVKSSLQSDSDIVNFWIDLFCGAGGTSSGIHLAGQNSFVAGCVNHDLEALESHELNHPFTIHFREDIRNFEVVRQLAYVVKRLREEFPGCFISLWASLECTNFSKAKGGQARDADSRTLAEHMDMYIEALEPDYFWVENVREFMAWGPLNDKGKPISKNNGRDYLRWVDSIKDYGYDFDWKLFNAADFGAYQSRERLFLQFAKKGLPISWPEPTHAKKASKSKTADLFSGTESMQAWKAVRDVLDLMDVGKSIFNRKKFFKNSKSAFTYLKKSKKAKELFACGQTQDGGVATLMLNKENIDSFEAMAAEFETQFTDVVYFRTDELSENTLKRIYAGLIKFVAKGDTSFIKKYFSGRPEGKVISTDAPAGTVTCVDHQSLVQVEAFTMQYNSGNDAQRVKSLDEPVNTITTGNSHAVVSPETFITQRNNGEPSSKVVDTDGPARTLTATGGNQDVVNIQYLNTYYGNGGAHDVDSPAPTVTTKDRITKMDVQFIMNQYSGGGQHTDIETPSATVTNVPKQNLVSAEPWIMGTNFGGNNKSIDEPGATITASRKHHYLINANSSTCPPSNLDAPAPVITQRTHLIVNPSWGGNPSGIDSACVTVIARQDKSPLYLITTEGGNMAVPVYDTDCETMVLIKQFMAAYNISDIKMRMLKIIELLQIQGFPIDYKLKGSKTAQKKFIGNAVEVTQAMVLADTHYRGIVRYVRNKRRKLKFV